MFTYVKWIYKKILIIHILVKNNELANYVDNKYLIPLGFSDYKTVI